MRAGAAAAGTLAALIALPGHSQGQTVEWSGYASLDPRIFLDRPLFDGQPDSGVSWSAALAPELRLEWREGRDRLTVSPHLRIDEHDSERTRADLREASWQRLVGPWMIVAGVSRVFWGVTESRHLVDVINQIDQAEDIDGDERLGQPMVHVERWTEAGTFGAFLLPGFRERTFPAGDARLRGPLPVARNRAEYESGARRGRLDLALRWTRAAGPWDLGLSAFHGTSREPRLVPSAAVAQASALVPHYDVITQLGADVLYAGGAWLWKLETILRSGHGSGFGAAVAGFEYTSSGLRGGGDLGLIVEYLHDGRDARAPPTTPGNGVFVGVRLMLNDPDGTSVLAGVLAGRSGDGTLATIEAERRLGEAWTLAVDLRLLAGVDAAHPYLGAVRRDSHVAFRLARHF